MKKCICLTAALSLLALTAGSAFADDTWTPGAGITGTPHDLSGATGIGPKYNANDTNNGLDRICVWCHAPHHAIQSSMAGGIDYLPIWNHGVTVQYYDTYDNGADDPDDSDTNPNTFLNRHQFNGQASLGQPGSVSRLCLSCHDGTVAINEYGFEPGRLASSGTRKGDTAAFIEDQWKIGAGGNLKNHHPIGFMYSDATAHDDEIADPSTPMGTDTTIGDLLYGGRMECVTCHDVHNSKNTGETFLWVSDVNSQFCLTCHLK